MIEIIQTGQDQNSRGEFSRQCFEIGSGLTSDSDVKEIVVILTRRVDRITFDIVRWGASSQWSFGRPSRRRIPL